MSWRPFLTLIYREVIRFGKQPWTTIFPPTVSVALYLIIFGYSLGPVIGKVQGYPYITFVLPGLLMMALIMNSFLNPAYSLFQARYFEYILDLIASPLKFWQIAIAYIIGGVVRGVAVTILVFLFSLLLTGIPVLHPVYVVLTVLFVSILFSSIGLFIGLWAENWDGITALQTFILNPLIYLAPIFYSMSMIENVPWLKLLVSVNPITYTIESFRYGFLGISSVDVGFSLVFLGVLAVISLCLSVFAVSKGYRIVD